METLPAASQAQNSGGMGLLSGMVNLPLLRQFGLLVGLAASVAIGVAVALWSREEPYTPLDAALGGADAARVVSLLDAQKIPYHIDPRSGALLVPADKVQIVKMKMAGAGLGGERAQGYELLDQESPFGSSQFMEATRLQRSLEGELARTITGLYAVRSARVHLALPKSTTFVRGGNKPRASIFVELQSGNALTPDQVSAMVNLVTSSVADLDAKDVSVVDQKGRLLSRNEEEGALADAGKQLEHVRRIEESLIGRVRRVVEPLVGYDHFTAEISADVDFTEQEQTSEQYQPDPPALRSEQTLVERMMGGAGDRGGVPGALSNQPPGAVSVPEVAARPTTPPLPAEAAAGAAASSSAETGRSRNQATRNYELDRTLSHTRQQVGKVRRLSIAVVVDDLPDLAPPKKGSAKKGAAEGKEAANAVPRRAWSDEELRKLTELVKGATGYDAARGDTLSVVNSSFVKREIEPAGEPVAFWSEPWFWSLAKQLLGGLFVVLIAIAILRPVMKNISAFSGTRPATLVAYPAGTVVMGEGGERMQTVAPITEAGRMISFDGSKSYEQQLDAVKGLVQQDPGRVAQVVKKWVNEGE